MRTTIVSILLAAMFATSSPALASAPLPVVARLDKVTVEVSKVAATLVIDARYVIRRPKQNPVIAVGRMHYKCDGDKLTQCLLAWSDLQKGATTNACVGWGQLGDSIPNPTVLYSTLATPTAWPVGMGVATLGKHRCSELDVEKKLQ